MGDARRSRSMLQGDERGSPDPAASPPRAGTVNLGRGLAGRLSRVGGRHYIQHGTVNLMECGRNDARDKAGDTDGYAVAATPVTSAQVWKARVRAARYWRAGR